MSDVESRVLCRELGQLGGLGAGWVSRLLPNVAHESRVELSEGTADVAVRMSRFLAEAGRPIPEFPSDQAAGSFSAVIGSGHLQLNPTILHVRIEPTPWGSVVTIRAVAKEGAVKQESARKLVERTEAALRPRAAAGG